MTESLESLQLAIWKEIAGTHLSSSHDRWHVDRVLTYATALARTYKADETVVAAAVLLHDLGRADPDRRHGSESLDASCEEASRILSAINYPAAQRAAVLIAIKEHDQPGRHPTTIEGKILKDADFLAGFGAWGILRIGMWSGETGRDVADTLKKLDAGMRERAAHLELPESVRWSRRDLFFARFFMEELGQTPSLPTRRNDAFYLVIEGVSGTGKDTQAGLLKVALERAGRRCRLIPEPSAAYKDLKAALTGYDLGEDAVLRRKLLFLLDRTFTASDQIEPGLSQGETIVAVRSFLSTMVYNCPSDADVAVTALLCQSFPQPDLIVILDVPAEEARRRIGGRGEPPGTYETLEQLELHAARYRALAEAYFPATSRVVNASGTIPEVAEAVRSIVLDAMRTS